MMSKSKTTKLPNNPEIEAAFLADLFRDPELLDTYADQVKLNYMYSEKHRKVYKAMRQVWSNDGALDTMTVIDELERRDELEAVEGANTINQIAGATPSAVNHEQHAQRVVKLARKRELIRNLEGHARSLRKDATELENVAKEATSNIREAIEGLDADGRPDDPGNFTLSPEGVAEWLTGEQPPKRPALLTNGDHTEPSPFLVRGKTGLLVAPGGGGKTGVLTQLAVAVAAGTQWLGHNVTKPGKVLLALGEEDNEEMQRRIHHAYNNQPERGDDLADRVADNLRPMPLYATNPRFMEPPGPTTLGDETPFYRNLVDYLEDNGPWSLVIIDPASRFMGAEVETDNAAATRFVELLEAMTQVEGAPTVLAAHHTNKGALGADRTDQGAARGSSALVDGVRWVANLERYDKDERGDLPDDLRDWRRLRVTKTNYTARPEPIALRWRKGWTLVGASDENRRRECLESRTNRSDSTSDYPGAERVL